MLWYSIKFLNLVFLLSVVKMNTKQSKTKKYVSKKKERKITQRKGFKHKKTDEYKFKKHAHLKALYNKKFSAPLRKKRNEYDAAEERRYGDARKVSENDPFSNLMIIIQHLQIGEDSFWRSK